MTGVKGIDILIQEHVEVLEMAEKLHLACLTILETKEVDIEFFKNFILFSKEFTDETHHGKEEDILFSAMTTYLGETAEKIINHGMLVEHDLNRASIYNLGLALENYEKTPNLEYALDIITYAMGYQKQILEHVNKENDVIFPYAVRELPKDILEKVSYDIEKAKNKQ